MTHTMLCGDAMEHLRTLPDGLARCCVTSPPYWGLRDYGVEGQVGGDTVLDPFMGSGTTVAVAERLGRHGLGIELNPSYVDIARTRCQQLGLFTSAAAVGVG